MFWLSLNRFVESYSCFRAARRGGDDGSCPLDVRGGLVGIVPEGDGRRASGREGRRPAWRRRGTAGRAARPRRAVRRTPRAARSRRRAQHPRPARHRPPPAVAVTAPGAWRRDPRPRLGGNRRTGEQPVPLPGLPTGSLCSASGQPSGLVEKPAKYSGFSTSGRIGAAGRLDWWVSPVRIGSETEPAPIGSQHRRRP